MYVFTKHKNKSTDGKIVTDSTGDNSEKGKSAKTLLCVISSKSLPSEILLSYRALTLNIP